MLKLTYGLLYNSRVCSRSAFSQFKEIATSSVLETNLQKTNLHEPTEETLNAPLSASNTQQQYENVKSKNKIIAAAFESLTKDPNKQEVEINTPHTDKKIADATNVEELLSVTNGEGVSRRLALKIVSVLADWTTTKKIKLNDFENDYRFVKLCKILTKYPKPDRFVPKSEDLSTVLSVTADEKAAKLVETLTLPQMVKIMKTLTIQGRRSMLLLRTLAYNISGNPYKMTLKQCSDLLYSISSLNFIDENLLSKVALDICSEIEIGPEVKKSAALGSISTSLGILKYKNPVLLDSICNWLVQNCDLCRSHDIFNLFVTLANLNYQPPNFEKLLEVFSPYLTELEAGNPVTWLTHIWAKVVLNVAKPEEVSYILSDDFLSSLSKCKGSTISIDLKVLNIDGAADCLIDGYNGNRLPHDSLFREVVLPKRKERTEISDSIMTSLKNLMKTEKYVKVNTDTGYGFAVDAECVIDEKFVPKEINTSKIEGTRIAIQPLDYHDMTKGRVEATGINVFAKRILEAKGYKVLPVPYHEFNPQTKLISRVQYLEKNLKELVRKS